MGAVGAKIVKQVLQPSMATFMSPPQKDRTHTSFPEKVKRHKVQHGVLDVVDLFFKWELQKEKRSYGIKHVPRGLSSVRSSSSASAIGQWEWLKWTTTWTLKKWFLQDYFFGQFGQINPCFIAVIILCLPWKTSVQDYEDQFHVLY